MKVNKATQLRVDRGQLLQPLCELFQLWINAIARTGVLVTKQRYLEIAASLPGSPGPDVVNHQSSKHLRRVCKEARSIESGLTLPRRDLEVRLVEERGGAQRDVAARVVKLARGQLVQFVVKRGEECATRVGVNAAR